MYGVRKGSELIFVPYEYAEKNALVPPQNCIGVFIVSQVTIYMDLS